MSLLFCSASSIARRIVNATGCGVATSCAGSEPPQDNPSIEMAARRITLRIVPPERRSTNRNLSEKLFVAQRLNRLQPRRLVRRQITKKQSRRAGHNKRDHDAHA